jgi:mRNA-degrading endonuclease RelE of RelBE toxin-antitoxin system
MKMPIEVIYSERFVREARQLKKTYRHVLSDILTLYDPLVAGDTPGDRIQGLPFAVYKARVRNSDARRGKSGGYRIIYYLETDEKRVLIFIYSKSDQSDIRAETIRRLIAEYEMRRS